MSREIPRDTFCILPWIHLSTRPDGSMRVCCTANASSVGPTNDKEHGGQVGVLKNADGKPANLNTTTLMDSWNNQYMRNVRTQMLKGEKPPSCLKCFREEESGHISKRMWETNYWMKQMEVDVQKLVDETAEDGSIPPKIQYIDLRMGTKCNLACIMCSPHDSSQWVPDWQKMFPEITNSNLKETMQWENKGKLHGASYNWHKQNPDFWDQLYDQIPHMRQLYFAGGESTIIEEHYTLLEEVIRRGYASQIELRYNSNGIELPDRLFAIWEKFKRVRFHFSIDSIEEMNNYIRYPSDWSHIEKQFRLLDDTPDHIEVTIACAVQALNIYYLPDFIRWKLEQNFKKINPWPLGSGMINYHFVYHPPHLNVKILPTWFKEKTEAKYNEFYKWLELNWSQTTNIGNATKDEWLEHKYGISRLKGMIKFMKSEDWSNRLPEMKEFLEQADKVRGTNWKTIFPEMNAIFD